MVRSAEAGTSWSATMTQVDVAMPPEERQQPQVAATPTIRSDPIPAVAPTLPLARANPAKRSGSNDIEGERPSRMRTPSTRSTLPPRPGSPHLSQQAQEERVPDGYVR